MESFNSQEELYNRIKPALKSKVKMFKKIGIDYVKEDDIWDYLKDFVWPNQNNLTLSEIVDNIMTLNYIEIEKYIHKKFERKSE